MSSDLIKFYRESLKTKPLLTKALTSCFIACLGEVLGGLYSKRKYGTPALNARRMSVFAMYGLLVSGPSFHYWYSQVVLYCI